MPRSTRSICGADSSGSAAERLRRARFEMPSRGPIWRASAPPPASALGFLVAPISFEQARSLTRNEGAGPAKKGHRRAYFPEAASFIDGRLAIDNNVAERALRTVAITRKNFLFLGSEAGGKRAATLYTVLESAKLNGLDPEAYLTDVIDRMAKGHPINRLAELLPWNWHGQPAKLAA